MKLLLSSGGITHAWQLMQGLSELGWKMLRVVELSALPSLPPKLWRDYLEKAGVYHDIEFNETQPACAGAAKTLGLVDCAIRPHLNADYFPQVTLENVETGAAKAGRTAYALDDQSTLRIIGGETQVISQGTWRLFETP